MAKPITTNTEVTQVTIQRAVETALAAVLQEQQQQKQQQKRPTKPPPGKVKRQVEKAAAGATKRPPKRGFRGRPPMVVSVAVVRGFLTGLGLRISVHRYAAQ
jgi:hypothetical protein